MSEDQLILMAIYAVNWLTLVWLTSKSNHKKRTIFMHLLLQVFYSLLCVYKFYTTHGWDRIGWEFTWALFVGVHWIILLIQLVIVIWRRKKATL